MKYRFFAIMTLMNLCSAVQAGTLTVHVTDSDGNPIDSAVVMATPTENQVKPKKSQKVVVIDQVDKEFVNYLTVIPTGTPVKFPNSDDIRHHVYSFSPAKQFELPLYSGTPAEPVVFDQPGVVKLGCNIHDWMVGYLYITDAPYYQKTDKDGKAQLINLPIGKYNLQLWHPRMKASESTTQQTIVVGDTEKNTASAQLVLKPDVRPRRAPLPIGQSY